MRLMYDCRFFGMEADEPDQETLDAKKCELWGGFCNQCSMCSFVDAHDLKEAWE